MLLKVMVRLVWVQYLIFHKNYHAGITSGLGENLRKLRILHSKKIITTHNLIQHSILFFKKIILKSNMRTIEIIDKNYFK